MSPTAAHTLRILMVTPRYFPDMGGVETHVSEVTRRLAHAGADVTILTTDRTGRRPASERLDGVSLRRVRAWPARRDYYFAPGIARAITDGPWDVVHCQSYHTLVAPLAMLAARRANIPYVVTFHGGGHSSRLRNALRGGQSALLRPLLARAARLIAIARFEIALYSSRLRLSTDRFVFIPNGAELPCLAQRAPTHADGALIVSVGRLERYKGHHRAITALPEVLKQRPDARLRIVGAGPYEPDLRRLAQRLGLSERVEIGAIPPTDRQGMAALLSSAALVALLSDYETHPIAALEALALGRPVLVTHTSGLGELADQGLARSVPLGSSPAQVASAILEQLRRPLAPARVDLPSWDDCATNLLQLYHLVVGRSMSCAS
ncbi:MAG: glycosyltransferase family 4 protein [Roseiflexaceae bacterium]